MSTRRALIGAGVAAAALAASPATAQQRGRGDADALLEIHRTETALLGAYDSIARRPIPGAPSLRALARTFAGHTREHLTVLAVGVEAFGLEPPDDPLPTLDVSTNPAALARACVTRERATGHALTAAVGSLEDLKLRGTCLTMLGAQAQHLVALAPFTRPKRP